MDTNRDMMSKHEFLAEIARKVPTRLEQARHALEERQCELSAWARGEVIGGGFKWITPGILCECEVVHMKGDEEYEQKILVQMFTDSLPLDIGTGEWLDAAGVFYRRKIGKPGNAHEYKAAIVTQSPRAVEGPSASFFEIFGSFYGWVRRAPVSDADLDRSPYTASAGLFSKGRSLGWAVGGGYKTEEIFERAAAKIVAHYARCGQDGGAIVKRIACTDAGHVIWLSASARMFTDTGGLLLRHPRIYRNDKAQAAIDARLRANYDSAKRAVYGSARGLRRAG